MSALAGFISLHVRTVFVYFEVCVCPIDRNYTYLVPGTTGIIYIINNSMSRSFVTTELIRRVVRISLRRIEESARTPVVVLAVDG